MFYRKMEGSQTCESVEDWQASDKRRHWWGRLQITQSVIERTRPTQPTWCHGGPTRTSPARTTFAGCAAGRRGGHGRGARPGRAEPAPVPGAVPVAAGGKVVVRALSSLGRHRRGKRRVPGVKWPGGGGHRAANPAFPARWWP